MPKNKIPLGQRAVSAAALRALDILIDARNCLDCVSAASGEMGLDGSPIIAVVNVAIDKVHRAIEILRGDDETEQEAA